MSLYFMYFPRLTKGFVEANVAEPNIFRMKSKLIISYIHSIYIYIYIYIDLGQISDFIQS